MIEDGEIEHLRVLDGAVHEFVGLNAKAVVGEGDHPGIFQGTVGSELLERTVLERTAELRHSEERFRRLTELASDWYWEQNESGGFTHISGPVLETLGIGMSAFLGRDGSDAVVGWDESERAQLQAKIVARKPFQDFGFSRANAIGARQYFRVSGEPIYDESGRFTGYRGIGMQVEPNRPARTTGG